MKKILQIFKISTILKDWILKYHYKVLKTRCLLTKPKSSLNLITSHKKLLLQISSG